MEQLLQGVSKFQRDVFPQHKFLFEELAGGQKPGALFITCADSRVLPSMITQTDPGELFICRNAGNMVPPYGDVQGGVSATIEYAVCELNVKHIIVCGHYRCGAVAGLLHPEALHSMPTVKSWLNHGEVARQIVKQNHPHLNEEETLQMLTQQNVVAQLQNLRTHPSVAARLSSSRIELHGWIYRFETGEVEVYDPADRTFVDHHEYALRRERSTERFAMAG